MTQFMEPSTSLACFEAKENVEKKLGSYTIRCRQDELALLEAVEEAELAMIRNQSQGEKACCYAASRFLSL